MRKAKRFGGVALGTALLVALALGSSVAAQQTDSRELQLTQQRNSGVSGTATLEDVEGGVEVTLNMQGLPEAGVEHINHFHGGGNCARYEAYEDVPVTIPLNTLVANEDGTASATTVVEGVTLERLFDRSQERMILVHDEEEEGGVVPPGIACVDLNATTTEGEGTTARETTEPLPKSGGVGIGGPSVLLPAAALFLGLGVLGFAVLRRR
jgi:Cu/Zn superoxide dismutase